MNITNKITFQLHLSFISIVIKLIASQASSESIDMQVTFYDKLHYVGFLANRSFIIQYYIHHHLSFTFL